MIDAEVLKLKPEKDFDTLLNQHGLNPMQETVIKIRKNRSDKYKRKVQAKKDKQVWTEVGVSKDLPGYADFEKQASEASGSDRSLAYIPITTEARQQQKELERSQFGHLPRYMQGKGGMNRAHSDDIVKSYQDIINRTQLLINEKKPPLRKGESYSDSDQEEDDWIDWYHDWTERSSELDEELERINEANANFDAHVAAIPELKKSSKSKKDSSARRYWEKKARKQQNDRLDQASSMKIDLYKKKSFVKKLKRKKPPRKLSLGDVGEFSSDGMSSMERSKSDSSDEEVFHPKLRK